MYLSFFQRAVQGNYHDFADLNHRAYSCSNIKFMSKFSFETSDSYKKGEKKTYSGRNFHHPQALASTACQDSSQHRLRPTVRALGLPSGMQSDSLREVMDLKCKIKI